MKLVIVGAGRHGRELESYLGDIGGVELLGFIDDNKPVGAFGTSKIIGGFAALRELTRAEQIFYITAAGDNRARQRLATHAEDAGLEPWSLVHPTAQVGLECAIAPGCCMAPGTIATRKVELGSHCVVNVGVTISHDCVIGEFTNLNPGATICGDVEIGRGCYIGAGATVIDKVSIGEWTVVGAGAVVVETLPPNVLALGVPARIVKHFDSPIRLV